MKKQLAFLLAICSGTKYILCDETFDGLDPVMRQAVKSLIAKEMQDREFTPIIASHNLRELEDICDTVGLLHQGGVLLSKDIDDMKGTIQKIQCVPKDELELKKLHDKFEMVKEEKRGSLYTCILRSDKDAVCDFLEEMDTVFAEVLPLTLEEIFICETEVVGYDIKKLVLEVL